MPSPVTTAPRHLWQIARDYIVDLFNLFGAPEQIAAQHVITTKDRNLLHQWLRTGEAILRQLLLIEASALDYVSCGPPASSRQRAKRIRRRVEFFPDKPEEWRVSFRCFSDRRRPRRHAPVLAGEGAGGPSHRFHNPWPLAERAEALLRAFNNPEPYARRLARRLRAAPHRAKALTTLPPNWDRCLHGAHEFREAAVTKLRHFEPG